MRRPFLTCLLVAPVVFLSVALTSQATSIPIRGGSHYGPLTPYLTCSAGSDPCEGFQQGPVIDIGGQNYQEFQFVSFVSSAEKLDVFEVGSITASTGSPFTFFLPLVNNTLDAGVFFCNNGTSNFAVDSGSPVALQLTGLPCTVGAPSTANFSETPQTGGIQLTFTGDFTDLTLFTLDGNLAASTVAAPEPASLLLLGTGLLVAGFGRRRKATGSSRA